MTAIVLVAVGVIAGVVYCHARHALAARIETVDRVPRRTLPGFCADCGASELTRDGRCATCGSNSIWCPGPMALPAIAPLVNQRYAEITRRAIARNERARGVTESMEVN